MRPENIPLLQLVGPVLFVIGAIYVLAPTLPMTRSWARILVFAAVWLIITRYIGWRLFGTVLPAHGAWYEVGWVWFCFTIEMLALVDALILYLAFLPEQRPPRRGRSSRSAAARDAADGCPSVDVYIPTYNEPMEVLEKTITGALCLDYPELPALGARRRPSSLAEGILRGQRHRLSHPPRQRPRQGREHQSRPDQDQTRDFVAIFDADFIPQRNFLMRTMGFFADPKIGIVQVPHAFYNHDPMQANLALRKDAAGRSAVFLRSDHAEPRRLGCRVLLRLKLGDAPRGATQPSATRCRRDSITEDMLLTLVLLRKGYITRYLCERLAFGLAPENLERVLCAASALGARRHANPLPGGGPAGAESHACAAAAVPADALVVAKLLLLMIRLSRRSSFCGPASLPLVNVTTRLGALLSPADGFGGGRRHRVYAPRTIFPARRAGAGHVSELQALCRRCSRPWSSRSATFSRSRQRAAPRP